MKHLLRVLVFLIFHFTATTKLGAQQRLSTEDLRRLDSIATQDVPPGAPGIATAIIQNGEVIYQKLAGFANLQDSVAISPLSRFNIASNGKQFTALGILLLENAGKIRLSDDIRKYLPELFPVIPHKISIENLLTHTSGIRDAYDLWSLQGLTWWKQTFDNRQVVSLLARQKNLNFIPGTSYLYSNSNYILLAQIIERISGQSFASYMNEIFQKLQMPGTSFEPDYTQIREPIARAYFNFSTWTTYQWIWNVCGDGNLFSTLNDQVHWEKIIQGKIDSGIDPQIINRSQQLVNPDLCSQYGYGLEFGTYKGLPYRFHEGATGAWKATVIRFPEKEISMITLTNTGKSIASSQTRQMADVIFQLPKDQLYFMTRPVTAGTYIGMDEIVGIYLTSNNFMFDFIKNDSALYLRRQGRQDIKLEREAGNIFRQANDTAFKQEFSKNSKGEMQVTAYYTSHAPYTLIRPVANWKKFDFTSINGQYINDETNTKLIINFLGDKRYKVKIGEKENTMEGILLEPGKLLVGGYALTIEKKRKSMTILLEGDRIKQVLFKKTSP